MRRLCGRVVARNRVNLRILDNLCRHRAWLNGDWGRQANERSGFRSGDLTRLHEEGVFQALSLPEDGTKGLGTKARKI